MSGDKSKISPIMTNSESIWQFGNNAYGKPATALNILRETVMGRELFDFAFKTYSNRWKFKSPEPADLFRTMEDASAVDLDWFWRGWFYTTDHVDISMSNIKWIKMDSKNPEIENTRKKKEIAEGPVNISTKRNKEMIKETRDERDSKIRDFYTDYNPLDFNSLDKEEYNNYIKSLSDEEKDFLRSGKNFYEITFENIGGLVMPIILEMKYKDGSTEVQRIPAEIWKLTNDKVTKVFVTEKEVSEIILDPFLETADTDRSNNYYPPRQEISRFELFKGKSGGGENPMQRDRRAQGKK